PTLSPTLIFLFTDPTTTALYPLSLHDALPISARAGAEFHRVFRRSDHRGAGSRGREGFRALHRYAGRKGVFFGRGYRIGSGIHRSEEHTSELQSRFDLVCRLLLEKKKLHLLL